jgi:hypothetical protein
VQPCRDFDWPCLEGIAIEAFSALGFNLCVLVANPVDARNNPRYTSQRMAEIGVIKLLPEYLTEVLALMAVKRGSPSPRLLSTQPGDPGKLTEYEFLASPGSP